MNKQQIEPFFQILQQVNPHPQTELEYTSVFELLCAVLMSAQATDVSVNKVTRVLFKVANTPEKLFKLGIPRLEEYIKTIGLFKSKAKHLLPSSKDSRRARELARRGPKNGQCGAQLRVQ